MGCYYVVNIYVCGVCIRMGIDIIFYLAHYNNARDYNEPR